MGHLGVSRYSEYFDCNILNTLIASLNISYQVVLYEYLGEEYPEVLGSILGALKAIVNVIGMTKMTPPIKDLLPRLTPILKNRYNRVSCVDNKYQGVFSIGRLTLIPFQT